LAEASLSLDNTQVTDAGLKQLTRLPSVRRLSLNKTRITDAGLPELKRLRGPKATSPR
jgi:hypothetical protein